MKVSVLGVARSGTTALYALLQEMLVQEYRETVDFIYEPFLWEKNVFNDKYNKVKENFKYLSSLSIEGVYNHLKLPLFITDPEKYENNEFLKEVFQITHGNLNILAKFVRANGRSPLIERICPQNKFIFLIRNPIDVINSSIVRFSLYGSDFHKDDFERFVKEVNAIYGVEIEETKIKSQVEKEVLYWYYMNRFALETFEKNKQNSLIICYEDYVSQRKIWVDRICHFLGIQTREKYYKISELQGGSPTDSVNLSQSQLQIFEWYLNKYKDLLEIHGIQNNFDFSEITSKYDNPPKRATGKLVLGFTPNFMNTRMMQLEKMHEKKDNEIRMLKNQLKLTNNSINTSNNKKNLNNPVKIKNPIIKIIKDKINRDKKFRFVNINPGFNQKFGHIGHHLNQNLHLKNKVIESDGDFFVLTCHDIDHTDEIRNLPIFTYSPWKLLKEGDSLEFYNTFEHELRLSVELINNEDSTTPNIFFMYMGDIRLIPTFLEVAKKTNQFKNKNVFFLNLFHTYNDFFPEGRAAENVDNELLALVKTTHEIRKRLGIYLFVEVETLQKKIYENTGERVLMLPKFTSAFAEDEFNSTKEKFFKNQKDRKFNFFYPTATKERGLEYFKDIILFLAKKEKLSPFQFIVRIPHLDNNDNQKILEEIEPFVEIKKGALSNEEYKSIFKKADAILLPYKEEEFYAKSSGILTDAIIAQKPVLTTTGTWLGRNTKKYKNGVTFFEGNLNSFWDALVQIKNNYEKYLENCVIAKSQWLEENSLDNFLKMLCHLTDNGEEMTHEKIPFDDDFHNSVMDVLKLLQEKNSIIRCLDKKAKQIEIFNQKILENNSLLEEKNKTIDNLKKGILKKNSLINEKKNDIDKLIGLNDNKVNAIEKSSKIIKALNERINERSHLLAEKNKTIGLLKQEIEKKNQILNANCEDISKLKEDNQNKTQTLDELKKKNGLLIKRISELDILLAGRNKTIESLRHAISEKNELLINKNKYLDELKNQSLNKNIVIEKKNSAIKKLKKCNSEKTLILEKKNTALQLLNQMMAKRRQKIVENIDIIDKLKGKNTANSKILKENITSIDGLRQQIKEREIILQEMELIISRLKLKRDIKRREDDHQK